MLVLEPSKRYSISQIKRHRWMQVEIPPQVTLAPPVSSSTPNEQILRLMQSLGIDSSKTRESIRSGSYDHHAAIYYLLLEKLRSQLGALDAQSAGRDAQRRRPSSIAEQAMRKIGRANTSEDCRRLLHHSTTVPSQHLASNCDVTTHATQTPSRPKTEPFVQADGIDAAKLLATTNSEDAIKLLQQSTSSTFTMSSEASKLMSTLQLSPVPPSSVNEKTTSLDSSRLSDPTQFGEITRAQTSTPPFKDYMNHIQTYAYIQNALCSQASNETSSPSEHSLLHHDSKCSLNRFTPITSSVCYSTDIQTQYSSSTDEGCETDLEDTPAPRLSYASSSSSSGVVTNFNSKSLSQNLSRDSSQSNFSTFESFEYQLSDSSDLASSLPSCTSTDRIGMSGTDHMVTSTSAIHPNVYVSKSNRALVNKHNPLVYLSSAKSGARNLTRSPVDFREGRRASDGLVAQQINQADASNNVIAFNSQKLSENTKAKGVLELHLVQKEAKKLKTQYQANVPLEEVVQMQQKHAQYLHLGDKPRVPKRISLPDNFNYVPNANNASCPPVSVETETSSSISKPPLQQLMQHRLLQQKRQILQKQCALSHQTSNQSGDNAHAVMNLSRRQMLRQASYKIAQQTQILPPLPLSDSESKDLMAFQAIVEGTNAAAASGAKLPTSAENWNNLPSSLQSSCQISELATGWQQPPFTAAWTQVPDL